MPDDNTLASADLEDTSESADEDTEDETDEDEEEDSSEEGTDDSDESSESNDDEGGSGGSGDKSESTVVSPTGKDLLDLLAADPDAQRLMRSSLEDLIAKKASEDAASAEAEEFQELIQKQDYAAIGQKLVERQQHAQAREEVSTQILKETFGPVYQDLFAQPELQKLTAEEKETLQPDKYSSDAHYVRALERFVLGKRHEAALEAEVTKRVKAITEAKANNTVGEKVRGKGIAAGPASVASSSPSKSSTDLIKHGLRAIFEPDSIGDTDD